MLSLVRQHNLKTDLARQAVDEYEACRLLAELNI